MAETPRRDAFSVTMSTFNGATGELPVRQTKRQDEETGRRDGTNRQISPSWVTLTVEQLAKSWGSSTGSCSAHTRER
eukprot:gene12446-biopygen14018